LDKNNRCSREVFELARKLVAFNPPLFSDHVPPVADRESMYPVDVVDFENDDTEMAWLIADIQRDRASASPRYEWNDVALLYRKHEIGDLLEAACLNAGIPCRLAQGRRAGGRSGCRLRDRRVARDRQARRRSLSRCLLRVCLAAPVV
jgi:superfamily I DNA/RNA helicase